MHYNIKGSISAEGGIFAAKFDQSSLRYFNII